MVKYIYERYNTIQDSEYALVMDSTSSQWGMFVGTSVSGYSDYRWFTDGRVEVTGSPVTIYAGGSGSLYRLNSGTSFSRLDISSVGANESNVNEVRYYTELRTFYNKGAYVDTVIAEDGTFPNNGHLGNYWYVKTNLASTPSIIRPNGGETVTSSYEIKWNNGSDAVSENLRTVIELSSDNGATWKVLNTVNVGISSYTHNFLNETESSLSRLRIKHTTTSNISSGYDTSDGVFTIIRNTPPKAPTLLSPVGIAIDREQVTRLSWRHNDDNIGDAQSKAVVQWKVQGATNWNTINVNNNNNYYDVSANVFPLGSIVWRVKTYDQLNIEGPYSNEARFTAAEASNAPIITAPTALIPIARPTVQWSSSDQVAYQIVIYNSLNAIVWDSGEVTSTNKAATIGINLENGGIYSIRLRTKNANNLWTDYAILNATVAYTPPPSPLLTTANITGGIRIFIEYPEPSETQPIVKRSELYRSEDAVNWIRISESVGNVFNDYAVASKKVYYYRVKVFSDSETMAESNMLETSIQLRGIWIYNVNEPSTVEQFLFNEDRAQSISTNGSLMRFAGRKFVIAEYDESESETYEVTLKITDVTKLEKLMAFIQSKETLCVRDYRGRKIFCHAFALPIKDEFYGYLVNLSFERVSYNEVV